MLRRFLLPAALLAACTTHSPAVTPPRAEFLLVSGDSTYWVTSGDDGLTVRGSPIMLAEYGGRFHELYVADDDHSYYDALLVGQLVFSRDLITGDSTAVFTDTLVDHIARDYERVHPDDVPLGPDDPVAERPRVVATSDLTLLAVHGPFLSLEYHADTRTRPNPGYHATWRTVVDMRVGHPVGVDDLVGPDQAPRTIAEGRRSYQVVIDAARNGEHALGDVVSLVLSEVSFDDRSFRLTDIHGHPAVVFAGRIAGRRDGQGALPLLPIPIDSEAWWGSVRPTLPTTRDSGEATWARPGYRVLARIDTADSVADVTLVDSASHRAFTVAQVHTPLRRVYWLDEPPIDSTTRRALKRAFNDAALYDDNVRVAGRGTPPGPVLLHPAVLTRSNPRPAARRDERRRPVQP
jgi:hypothetical protein